MFLPNSLNRGEGRGKDPGLLRYARNDEEAVAWMEARGAVIQVPKARPDYGLLACIQATFSMNDPVIARSITTNQSGVFLFHRIFFHGLRFYRLHLHWFCFYLIGFGLCLRFFSVRQCRASLLLMLVL